MEIWEADVAVGNRFKRTRHSRMLCCIFLFVSLIAMNLTFIYNNIIII